MPVPLSPWELAVVALAAFRVVTFFVFDSLVGAHPSSGSNFSRWLVGLNADQTPDGQPAAGWAYKRDGSERSWLRGKIADLLTCPYCFGFWASAGLVAAWYWGPGWARWAVTVWAVAGAALLLNVVDMRLHPRPVPQRQHRKANDE